MDRIEFRRSQYEFPLDQVCDVLEVFINDRSLVDLWEATTGDKTAPIHVEDLLSAELVGAPAVLTCTCGQIVCLGAVVEVEQRATTVVWRNFQHSYEYADPGPFDIGPFEFDRADYERALRAVSDA